jgi:hypothetical protein
MAKARIEHRRAPLTISLRGAGKRTKSMTADRPFWASIVTRSRRLHCGKKKKTPLNVCLTSNAEPRAAIPAGRSGDFDLDLIRTHALRQRALLLFSFLKIG